MSLAAALVKSTHIARGLRLACGQALPTLAAGARADQALWQLGLGPSALQALHYRGSDQNHRWLLPLP